jgi:protocatechuate 3,4-dioxygenase beta subunit
VLFREIRSEILCALLWMTVAGCSESNRTGADSPTPRDSSVVVIAGPHEPGARLIVIGHIWTRDGSKVVAGTRVGLYHTDASGNYGVHPVRRSFPPNRDARLSGWLVTDATGRFEVHTIRPGLYPGGGTPAHIHFIVGGQGNYELRFADDRLNQQGDGLSSRSRVQVRPVEIDASGTQHVTVDWRLP